MSSFYKIFYLLFILILTFFFVYLNIFFSKDFLNYVYLYETVQGLNFTDVYAFSLEKDVEYFYLFLNSISTLGFEYFLFIEIFIGFLFKGLFFKLLSNFFRINISLFIFSYIAFLGLLNDGAQIRISMAFSIFLLALYFKLLNKTIFEYIFYIIGILLHKSLIILVIAIVFFNFIKKFLTFKNVLISFFIGLILQAVLINDYFSIEYFGRYSEYIMNNELQNSTGFIIYYKLFICILCYLDSIYKQKKIINIIESKENKINYIKIFDFFKYSIYFAGIFSSLLTFSVPLSVRVSELFIIFYIFWAIIVIYSNNFIKKKKDNKYFLYGMFYLIIIIFLVLRFYHTFIYKNINFE